MNWIGGYCLVTGSSSVVIFSVLAMAWAKSRSPRRYALSVVAVWVIVSTLPLSARPWESTTFRADAAHFRATMIWAAPFMVCGLLGLVGFVATGASRNKILVASLATSVVAVPISFLSLLYGVCSLGDCL